MNGHLEFLELIATSIDFDLTDEEFGRLSTHLARCPECRRSAEELRGDATAIEAIPTPRLAPARSEQILRANDIDAFYFSVRVAGGRLLAGDADFPAQRAG